MDALWALFVGTKVGRWIVGMALAIAGVSALLGMMFLKGKHAQAKTDDFKDAQSLAEAAQQAVAAANVRKDVENETAKLPDAPPQTVETADPDTAAGQLRTDGWVRPAGPNGH